MWVCHITCLDGKFSQYAIWMDLDYCIVYQSNNVIYANELNMNFLWSKLYCALYDVLQCTEARTSIEFYIASVDASSTLCFLHLLTRNWTLSFDIFYYFIVWFCGYAIFFFTLEMWLTWMTFSLVLHRKFHRIHSLISILDTKLRAHSVSQLLAHIQDEALNGACI